VRWRRLLDWLIERATEGREQKPAVREILRLGLYQIFFLSRIPEHAIVDESVRLAKAEKCLGQAGFINAMMRRFLREREQITRDIADLQDARPALGQSHPDWLYEQWEQRWGREKTVRLMEWNNQPAPTCARVNRLLTDPQRLAKRWEDEGVEASPIDCDCAATGDLFRLRKHPRSSHSAASATVCSTCRTPARCSPSPCSIRSPAKPCSTSAPRPAARPATSPSA
jgi:16S rRNA (cytosine967-C5)-methyltransferase